MSIALDEQQQPQQRTELPATPAAPAPASTAQPRAADDEQWNLRYIYPTAGGKAHDPRTNSIPIVTQDANGPCSLVALSNILLLRGGALTITPPDRPAVDFAYLSRSIAELFLTTPPPEGTHTDTDDWQRTCTQALDILPSTRHGLDVNVDFRSPTAFHPPASPQLALFRLFRIRLVHGWLPDPADRAVYEALVPSARQDAPATTKNEDEDEEEWRRGSDYDAVIQRLVAAQDFAGSFADLDIHPGGPPSAAVSAGTANADPAGGLSERLAATTLQDASAAASASQSAAQPAATLTDPVPAPAPGPDTWTPTQQRAVADALHIRAFLEANPTQLSVYGLFALAAALQPGELCALFRNMHLSCLYRRREDEGEQEAPAAEQGGESAPSATAEAQPSHSPTPYLFTLVTDAVLAREHPQIVWESLEDVHGAAGAFYDARFRRVEIAAGSSSSSSRRRRGQERGEAAGAEDGRHGEGSHAGGRAHGGAAHHGSSVPEGFWDPVVPGSQSAAAAGGEGYGYGYGAADVPPAVDDGDYALAIQLQQEERAAARREQRRASSSQRQHQQEQEQEQEHGRERSVEAATAAAMAGTHEDLGNGGGGSAGARRGGLGKKRLSKSGGEKEKCVVM